MASFFYSNDESAQIDTHARKRAMLSPVQESDDAPVDLDEIKLGARRTEVSPPSRFASSPPLWRTWLSRAWRWLWDLEESPRALAPATGLRAIKNEFNAALWDLQSLRANQVRDQIETARSLRELWHLRADVFKVISTHRGQIEAQLRLDSLDSHFPVRASRKGEDARGARVTTW
ncbi:MAG: hypothetical protein I8H76_00300 [Burkholderiales bacterium]|nr:hypothetical protein [Burkholderiales bacterium]